MIDRSPNIELSSTTTGSSITWWTNPFSFVFSPFAFRCFESSSNVSNTRLYKNSTFRLYTTAEPYLLRFDHCHNLDHQRRLCEVQRGLASIKGDHHRLQILQVLLQFRCNIDIPVMPNRYALSPFRFTHRIGFRSIEKRESASFPSMLPTISLFKSRRANGNLHHLTTHPEFTTMEANCECPVCKRKDCFVCRLWRDDATMDLLMAENGRNVGYFT